MPAGHDQFGTDQMYKVLGTERGDALERFGCLHNALLNMTYLALRFSRYVNGVAMQPVSYTHLDVYKRQPSTAFIRKLLLNLAHYLNVPFANPTA